MSFENLFSNLTASDFDRFCSPDNESNSDNEEKEDGLVSLFIWTLDEDRNFNFISLFSVQVLIRSSESDEKMKLLNDLCDRDTEFKTDSSVGLKSGDIFPPDYLDKYLTADGDFDRTTWVRNTAEDEIKLIIKCAVRRQVVLVIRCRYFNLCFLRNFVL